MVDHRKFVVGLALASILAVPVRPADPAAKPEDQPPWKTTIAAGLTLTDGNTETSLGNASWLTEHKMEEATLRIGAEGAYGKTDGDTTVENAKGFAGYRHTIDGRTYGLVDATLLRDEIADVEYRFILSPGIGYNVYKTDDASLGLELGPSYIREKVGDTEDDVLALRVANRYERQLSANSKVWQFAEYLPDVQDFDSFLVNAELGLEAPLTARLNLRFVIKDTYDSTPADGREKNDVTFISAIAMTF